ncbi:hypothetical protein OHA72_22810 [Dactylosporangium sp. NBC_01737]|uniref:hypothetical protein n=1 Tax=Dactylosporangium sp. NBC_01737 TaxID=2975959 RepID=UPI002E11461C|nr:hypothetical protein OHA72_22810 [Dactylosporangium sp. NBC_01737]
MLTSESGSRPWPGGFDVVSEPDVVTLSGAGARVYRTPYATYVLGPDAFIVVVEPGDRPDGTAVQDRQLLKLTGPLPDEVNTFLLQDLIHQGPRSPATETALLGFVRVEGGCMPLGPIALGGGGVYDPCEERLVEYRLRLRHALPFEALDRARPPLHPPPPPSTTWLDLVPDDPVAATREFITGWYADVPPRRDVVVPRSVPAALASFHTAAAGRDEVLGRQDHLFPPHMLHPGEDGWLEFGAENQGGFVLAFDPATPDPTVLYRYWTDEPIVDPHPLSTFLLLFALYEASFTGPYLASANLTTEQAQQLTQELRRVPLRNRWWPSTDTEFHVGNGLIVQLTPAEGATWYTFTSARHRAHLEPLRHLDIRWKIFQG